VLARLVDVRLAEGAETAHVPRPLVPRVVARRLVFRPERRNRPARAR
jgi:hypothetical protein